VDYADISRTVGRLRAELNLLGYENRNYFRKKSHNAREILNHQQRMDRVREIKVELERLMSRKGA